MLKVKNILIILFLLSSSFGSVMAQESGKLLTLFTTPQERQVINNNRYKGGKPVKPVTEIEPVKETDAVEELVKEEVNVTYMISGVSTSTEGSGIAWVNGNSYESGEVMDDGAKIRIKNSSVIITTPDGANHTAVSGEVLNLTYLRTIQQ
jgi:hypothetical protein